MGADDQPRDEHGRFSSGGGGSDIGKWADKRSSQAQRLFAGALLNKANKEGGFSYRPGGVPKERVPKTGFMVSVPVKEGLNHVVNIDELAKNSKSLDGLQKEIRGRVEKWLGKAMPGIEKRSDHFLGGWMERHNEGEPHAGEPKALHLDVSERFKDKDKAISAGKERNQKAIWHLDKGEEISTGGTGT